MNVFHCPKTRQTSTPGSSKADFVSRRRVGSTVCLCLQPLENRNCAGEHGFAGYRQALPAELLAFAHLKISRPLAHFAKVQVHQTMRVVNPLFFPGMRNPDRDAQLFVLLPALSLV
jgi:hypothetical protein